MLEGNGFKPQAALVWYTGTLSVEDAEVVFELVAEELEFESREFDYSGEESFVEWVRERLPRNEFGNTVEDVWCRIMVTAGNIKGLPMMDYVSWVMPLQDSLPEEAPAGITINLENSSFSFIMENFHVLAGHVNSKLQETEETWGDFARFVLKRAQGRIVDYRTVRSLSVDEIEADLVLHEYLWIKDEQGYCKNLSDAADSQRQAVWDYVRLQYDLSSPGFSYRMFPIRFLLFGVPFLFPIVAATGLFLLLKNHVAGLACFASLAFCFFLYWALSSAEKAVDHYHNRFVHRLNDRVTGRFPSDIKTRSVAKYIHKRLSRRWSFGVLKYYDHKGCESCRCDLMGVTSDVCPKCGMSIRKREP